MSNMVQKIMISANREQNCGSLDQHLIIGKGGKKVLEEEKNNGGY